MNETCKNTAIVAYSVKLGYLGGLSLLVDTPIHPHPEETNADFINFKREDRDCPASLKGYAVLGSHLISVEKGHPLKEDPKISCYIGLHS